MAGVNFAANCLRRPPPCRTPCSGRGPLSASASDGRWIRRLFPHSSVQMSHQAV